MDQVMKTFVHIFIFLFLKNVLLALVVSQQTVVVMITKIQAGTFKFGFIHTLKGLVSPDGLNWKVFD